MSGGVYMMLISKPPPRCKSSTLIVVGRKARSKWWWVECFGQKSHYRKDGTCAHTDEVIARLNPEVVPVERVRVKGFGGASA